MTNRDERAARHRDNARKLREQAAEPKNDHNAISLRENAAEWERIAERIERGKL